MYEIFEISITGVCYPQLTGLIPSQEAGSAKQLHWLFNRRTDSALSHTGVNQE